MEENILAHIKTKMVLMNLNQKKLAKKLEKTQSWVSRHLSDPGSMTVDDLLKICRTLKIKITIGEN